jgi:hypothetical protein
MRCPCIFFLLFNYGGIVDTTCIESIHERERGRCGDSGIHPRARCGRVAGVSRAVSPCRVISTYRMFHGSFWAISNLYTLVSTFVPNCPVDKS